jgi:ubiquitin carboxyl-terminal hydrolase 36/42
MGECEVFYQVAHGVPLSCQGSTLTVHCAEGLPQTFFDTDRIREIFRRGGPVRQIGGLINARNNCYMNSVLQCLAYTPGLASFCMNMPNAMYLSNAKDAFFMDSFAHLFDEMQTNRCACPEWFLNDSFLLNGRFCGPIQQDAHEYLIALLDRFDQECLVSMRSQCGRVDTLISHYFTWKMSSETLCGHCRRLAVASYQTNDLTFPIRGYKNLQEAFDKFATEEPFSVMSECEHCGSKKQTTANIIDSCPLIMTITLLRFDNQLRKIDDFFEFPEILPVKNMKTRYQLYALIVHEGRVVSHGHFFAYIRDEKGNWYKADDLCVFRAKKEAVMESRPYVLFYKRLL